MVKAVEIDPVSHKRLRFVKAHRNLIFRCSAMHVKALSMPVNRQDEAAGAADGGDDALRKLPQSQPPLRRER